MDFDVAERAVQQYLAANWSTTPIRWEDVPWDQVAQVDSQTPPEDRAWIEVFVVEAGSENISIGDPTGLAGGALRTRYTGMVAIHIYTREGRGSRRRKALASQLNTLLQNRYVAPITFREGHLGRAESPNEGYKLSVLKVAFQRDTKT